MGIYDNDNVVVVDNEDGDNNMYLVPHADYGTIFQSVLFFLVCSV